MTKTKGEITKERIIKKSAMLFLEHGYTNTGISSILEASKIPKGAFYFHFKSKNELGAAVAADFSNELSTWFDHVLEITTDWSSFVKQLTADIHQKIETSSYLGCPFSCFGTETAVIDQTISEICTSAINQLGQIFAEAMFRHENLTEKEMKNGFVALSMYEGYLVYFRISHNEKVIDTMKDALIELVVKE